MSDDMIESGFAATYGFELLFSEKPEINTQDILLDLENTVGKIDHKNEEGQNIFFMLDHLVEYSDEKKLPSQIVLLHADSGKDTDSLETEVQQSWQTPNAAEIVDMTTHKILLTDIMSAGLPFRERHFILSKTLKSFVTNSNCIGVACKRTAQIIDAKELKTSSNSLLGFINIRFFNAGNNGLVMDSLGLSALGLIDVQCHFTGLDPNEVSNHLYNTAYYIFNEEPVFENGHTIAGLNQKNWIIQFEESLIEPQREVLDFNPGNEYSVENR